MPANPHPARVVLVAVLGLMLTVAIAWRTGVHLHPAGIQLPAFVTGLLGAALLGLFLHATAPGARVLDYLSNTTPGQLLVLLVGAAIILLVRGVLDVRYAAELVSLIIGASIGSLARLALR